MADKNEQSRGLKDLVTQRVPVLLDSVEVDDDITTISFNGMSFTQNSSVPKKGRDLTVKVDVDVSEALTGLKAVQREAKKAAQALRELEAAQLSAKESECFRCGGTGLISLGEGVRGVAKCAYCKDVSPVG